MHVHVYLLLLFLDRRIVDAFEDGRIGPPSKACIVSESGCFGLQLVEKLCALVGSGGGNTKELPLLRAQVGSSGVSFKFLKDRSQAFYGLIQMLQRAADAVRIVVDVVEQTQYLDTHVADAGNGSSELHGSGHGGAKW